MECKVMITSRSVTSIDPLREVGLTLTQKAKKFNQISYIAVQKEIHFLVFFCEKGISQIVKCSCVATLVSSNDG